MQRRKFTPKQRYALATRAGFRCEYCLSPEDYSPDTFDIEHIIPLVKGGTNEVINLALACGGCNCFKFTDVAWTDPETGLRASLFHPRLDGWSEHFAWSGDLTLLIGLPPTGRATIDKLKMNRPNLVNLRRALVSHSVHPGMMK